MTPETIATPDFSSIRPEVHNFISLVPPAIHANRYMLLVTDPTLLKAEDMLSFPATGAALRAYGAAAHEQAMKDTIEFEDLTALELLYLRIKKIILLDEEINFGHDPLINRPRFPLSHVPGVITWTDELGTLIDMKGELGFEDIDIQTFIKTRLTGVEQFINEVITSYLEGGIVTWLNNAEKEDTLNTIEKVTTGKDEIKEIWTANGGDVDEFDLLWGEYEQSMTRTYAKFKAIEVIPGPRYELSDFNNKLKEMEINLSFEDLYTWANDMLHVVHTELDRLVKMIGNYANAREYMEKVRETTITISTVELEQAVLDMYQRHLSYRLYPKVQDPVVRVVEIPEAERNIKPVAAAVPPGGRTAPYLLQVNPSNVHSWNELVNSAAHEHGHGISSKLMLLLGLHRDLMFGPPSEIASEGIAVSMELVNVIMKFDKGEQVSTEEMILVLQQVAWRLSRVVIEYKVHIEKSDHTEIIKNHISQSLIDEKTARADVNRGESGVPLTLSSYILGYLGMHELAGLYHDNLLYAIQLMMHAGAGMIPPHMIIQLIGPHDFQYLREGRKLFAVQLSREFFP